MFVDFKFGIEEHYGRQSKPLLLVLVKLKVNCSKKLELK